MSVPTSIAGASKIVSFCLQRRETAYNLRMGEAATGSPTSDPLSEDSLSLRDKTLMKRSVSKHHNNNFKAGYVPVHEQYLHKTGLRGRKTFVFWTLVGLLFVLAVGNLILTVTILGVLRLGQGMQSLELIPEAYSIKFFGNADLGHLYKRDGLLFGFSDTPVEIIGDNGSLLFSLVEKNDRPVNKVKMDRKGTVIRNVDTFEVKNKHLIFSTDSPTFNNLRGAKNIASKMTSTNRITSPMNQSLEIRSEKMLELKGAEGTKMEGREIVWSADEGIYLKSVNGSVILSGKEGISVDVKSIPIAVVKHAGQGTSQYKVCVCMPQGKLFRIPVPTSPNLSNKVNCNHVNMLPKHNPCM